MPQIGMGLAAGTSDICSNLLDSALWDLFCQVIMLWGLPSFLPTDREVKATSWLQKDPPDRSPSSQLGGVPQGPSVDANPFPQGPGVALAACSVPFGSGKRVFGN